MPSVRVPGGRSVRAIAWTKTKKPATQSPATATTAAAASFSFHLDGGALRDGRDDGSVHRQPKGSTAAAAAPPKDPFRCLIEGSIAQNAAIGRPPARIHREGLRKRLTVRRDTAAEIAETAIAMNTTVA